MKKVYIDISGMDCASDAIKIENSILKLKGVKSASVNYLIHEGFISVTNRTTKEQLVAAVKRAGYKVVNVRFEDGK